MSKLKTVIAGILSVTLLVMVASCVNNSQMEFNRYYSNGSAVYQTHCQNCHGTNGEGLQGLIPPLTDSTYLKTNKNILACIIKNGVKGKITVGNKQFEGEMPASGLAPVEIAQVLTYINNSFGNKSGTFTTEDVNADLGKCN
ncbi:cytochrome c [Mucilaginibacter sp. L3T2-6]|uniref:c-type cytochrome n=1 Tax=Mucilaginibacter sp. L3T2-6 TaxID=3062491 RepID=UPI0026773616|nr:cytochrome c [Mucilaginibacter sp. L3T2-6]MDO3643013.1 cytochrome c [Mucilaginibacter sp. L3T2-6]MDV6215780.1 cytochrome c [Mucilaginibacter sp. L3T2-6]